MIAQKSILHFFAKQLKTSGTSTSSTTLLPPNTSFAPEVANKNCGNSLQEPTAPTFKAAANGG